MITQLNALNVEIAQGDINTILEKSELSVELHGSVIQLIDGERYSGDYESTPSFSNQLYNTANLVMADDFLVKAIPVASVSNVAGGRTVTIGG